jgi:hypothetical protein
MRYRTNRVNPRLVLRKSVVTSPREVVQVGRNDPCPCGSGEKYKNCCIEKGDNFLRKMAAKARREKEGSLLRRIVFGKKKEE